jgi:hypothetical protein
MLVLLRQTNQMIAKFSSSRGYFLRDGRTMDAAPTGTPTFDDRTTFQ